MGNISHFHDLLSRWPTNISPKNLWMVIIVPYNQGLAGMLSSNLPQYEVNQKGPWKIQNGAKQSSSPQTNFTAGCTFAQNVTVPGESLNTTHAGGAGNDISYGFLKSPIANGRTAYEPIPISFIDTNVSFVDCYIRPWVIMTGHYGLVARSPQQSIKASIYIHQFSRTGKLRKQIFLHDAAPISVSSENLSYSEEGVAIKEASFVYTWYTVTDG